MIKGLEVARQFFDEWGLPYLEERHPHLVDRAAAFICGGSQSLGNDDRLSRDHGWGPYFEIVLTGEDMRRFGRKLAIDLNREAPREWKGHVHRWPPESIEVRSIDPWLRNYVGCERPPARDLDWLRRTNEDYLYMFRHATIFHDPLAGVYGESGVRADSVDVRCCFQGM